eukprot:scaffold202405_cov20-Tisochrysis_lutea.AAC.1
MGSPSSKSVPFEANASVICAIVSSVVGAYTRVVCANSWKSTPGIYTMSIAEQCIAECTRVVLRCAHATGVPMGTQGVEHNRDTRHSLRIWEHLSCAPMPKIVHLRESRLYFYVIDCALENFSAVILCHRWCRGSHSMESTLAVFLRYRLCI